MFKFNKDKFEIFTGWLLTLIIIINVMCPVAGLITGVLIKSQNYISLILAVFAIVMLAYILTVNEVAELV